jgi:hypothetical protein
MIKINFGDEAGAPRRQRRPGAATNRKPSRSSAERRRHAEEPLPIDELNEADLQQAPAS